MRKICGWNTERNGINWMHYMTNTKHQHDKILTRPHFARLTPNVNVKVRDLFCTVSLLAENKQDRLNSIKPNIVCASAVGMETTFNKKGLLLKTIDSRCSFIVDF